MDNGLMTTNGWKKIREVEKEKCNILIVQEQCWRLKCRAIWLKEGDKNTKYFHSFANGLKNTNSIWEIRFAGQSYISTDSIQDDAIKHFKGLLGAREGSFIEEQLWVVEFFPMMFQ